MNRKLLKTALLVGVLTLAAGAGQAWAQSATTTFQVNASVAGSCEIRANALDFGMYSPIDAAPVDQTSTLQVRCTKGVTATVALNDGANSLSGQRRMAGGSEFLPYDLYRASTRAAADRWGNTVGFLASYTASNNGWRDLTVYGRIPADQDVTTALSLTDTITATVNF